MYNKVQKRWRVLVLAALLVGAAGVFSVNFFGLNGRVAHADPTGIKYLGANSCSAAACHGAPKPKEDKATRHNENTSWAEADKHAKAFNGKKGMKSPAAAKIAKGLGIAAADKSDRCLNCHSLSGISLKGGANRVALGAGDKDASVDMSQGVTCDACHGPSAKYKDPHTAEGWTAGKRGDGSAKLFDDFGLFNTKDAKFRANDCLSCHLKIEGDMIAAGHPELGFELNLYSLSDAEGGSYEGQHWRDKGAFFPAKAWAMGQVVSMREAAYQTADRIEKKSAAPLILDSYKRVIAFGINAKQVAQAVDAGSVAAIDAQLKAANEGFADTGKVAAAMKELAKASDALADKLNEKTFDKGLAEGLAKAVAAEGENASKSGFRPAEQFYYSMKSLTIALKKDAQLADADKILKYCDEDKGGLFDSMGEASSYDAAKFGAAAKKMGDFFKGGAALPLPAGVPADGK